MSKTLIVTSTIVAALVMMRVWQILIDAGYPVLAFIVTVSPLILGCVVVDLVEARAGKRKRKRRKAFAGDGGEEKR